MEPVAVILNPSAGRGRAEPMRDSIALMLEQWGVEHEIAITEGPEDATRLAEKFVRQEYPRIGVCGGDGTLNEAARALIGSKSALGPIPFGTGNDLARHIGLPPYELAPAVTALCQARPTAIDVASVHDRLFINVMSCGFDAEVGVRVNKGGLLKGKAAYYAAILSTLGSFKAAEMTVVADGKEWSGRAMLCAVGNASMYGGGLKIAPEAQLSDGLLDVVILGDMTRLEFIKNFNSVHTGAHIAHPKVHGLRGREIEIKTERPLPILADGELAETTPCQISLEPKALKVLMPESPSHT